MSIGEGRVFSAELNGSVEALNQQTGKLVWRTELGEPAEGFTVTSAPLYYEGMIFIGPVGSEYGVRGFMEAFNAKTGALVWKHYNIPAPGEFGHETWPTGHGHATNATTNGSTAARRRGTRRRSIRRTAISTTRPRTPAVAGSAAARTAVTTAGHP